MTNKEAKELVRKYRAGNCTEEEKALLNAWYLSLASGNGQTPAREEIEKALKDVSGSLPLKKYYFIRSLQLGQIAAAVLVLFLFSASIYFLREQRPASGFSGNIYKNDVAPGGNKAVLELADGSVIDLNNAAIGSIDHKGPVRITKTREDQVIYQPALEKGKVAEMRYNTIRTPRGGQYQVVLPDGSGAWLNSASSIRFPAMFTDGERKVEITGEVYFEVVRKYRLSDTGKVVIPFIVVASNQRIEAIGTQFNINAYPGEGAIRTTLLEGSVRISLPAGSKFRLLKPGQQAQIGLDPSRSISISQANVEKIIAWKNGQFQYDMEGIETIMRQVERWYDVEVVYEGEIPEKKFVGTISRNISLSKFLDILSYTGVNFRIEGRKIVVMS
ncbi:FecR family protein [Anseongella ginsenosidimutans]|uniref:FecR family protein n=1 Tax=Anseongella ginsenosidimutans TaxID=496056 RepID=A0A4R3KX02_9SPHI|nr:FecR family protein [Anseongella ginsenosidimutans]QEC51145.1 DUF4974 domain-containing protein [Anseongella ginsenosidimutans]TCS90185.1 FecR family protein [Anseongella ginsenosidimutans]